MNKFKGLVLMMAVAAGLSVYAQTPQTLLVSANSPVTAQNAASYLTVNPLDVIARPNFYMNKNIKIKAKFDKFSTLGLDYKPAMRSSEKYISFLIQRPDVTDHNIPLSE